jgi:hypothetical protein
MEGSKDDLPGSENEMAVGGSPASGGRRKGLGRSPCSVLGSMLLSKGGHNF